MPYAANLEKLTGGHTLRRWFVCWVDEAHPRGPMARTHTTPLLGSLSPKTPPRPPHSASLAAAEPFQPRAARPQVWVFVPKLVQFVTLRTLYDLTSQGAGADGCSFFRFLSSGVLLSLRQRPPQQHADARALPPPARQGMTCRGARRRTP